MEIITIMIVFVVVILAITFIPGLFEGKEKVSKKVKTNVGTSKLNGILSSFAKKNGYKYIPEKTFALGEDNLKIDGILVGSFGVLAVLANGRNGQIYANDTEKMWTQITAQQKTYFENPKTIEALAVRAIRKPLDDNSIKNVFIECVTVFTDNKAQIAANKNCKILRTKDFKAFLASSKFTQTKNVDIQATFNALSN